jgi:hypothetical protein
LRENRAALILGISITCTVTPQTEIPTQKEITA